MLILKILEHDLHRARATHASKIPYSVIVPDNRDRLTFPVLVSSTRGKFIPRRRIIEGGHPCGIFPFDSDKLDDMIGPTMTAAFDLSVGEKWDNVFKTPLQAFGHVQKASGTSTQPHACLVPTTWTDAALKKWGGKELVLGEGVEVYKRTCRVYRCNTPVPVFLSRPDFVGVLTQFLGGMQSILLHNVRHGMAFVSDGVPRKAD